MKELEAYLQRLLDTYERQPRRLEQAIGDYSEDQLHQAIGRGGWSPHQIVARVAAAEQNALAPRLHRILEQDRPALQDWDETRWMDQVYDPGRPVGEWLAQFQGARQPLIPRLRGLKLEDWNRIGAHPHRGERTLLWWLEYAVQHVREHLRQLAADGD